MTPTIRGASVAKPEGNVIRIALVVDGKIVEFVAARHVVASLVGALASALARDAVDQSWADAAHARDAGKVA